MKDVPRVVTGGIMEFRVLNFFLHHAARAFSANTFLADVQSSSPCSRSMLSRLV